MVSRLCVTGFLSLGNVHHDQLTYSQYIAPLMADFDASHNHGNSMIIYTSTSSFFIAKWSNVQLMHCSERQFSFSVCLFENGNIVFAYDKIPQLHLLNGKLQGCSPVNTTASINMSETLEWRGGKRGSFQRDVIVGISDAYLYEGADRRRIAEYATINIPLQLIRSGTIITLTPLPRLKEDVGLDLGGKLVPWVTWTQLHAIDVEIT
ncbi:Plexin domain-containing protein 1 [Taenia solium]|eukprot:TsM_000234000 transcript=TsM_000234000 gene=TsM_000234000